MLFCLTLSSSALLSTDTSPVSEIKLLLKLDPVQIHRLIHRQTDRRPSRHMSTHINSSLFTFQTWFHLGQTNLQFSRQRPNRTTNCNLLNLLYYTHIYPHTPLYIQTSSDAVWPIIAQNPHPFKKMSGLHLTWGITTSV